MRLRWLVTLLPFGGRKVSRVFQTLILYLEMVDIRMDIISRRLSLGKLGNL